jgi:hypothetical protein
MKEAGKVRFWRNAALVGPAATTMRTTVWFINGLSKSPNEIPTFVLACDAFLYPSPTTIDSKAGTITLAVLGASRPGD